MGALFQVINVLFLSLILIASFSSTLRAEKKNENSSIVPVFDEHVLPSSIIVKERFCDVRLYNKSFNGLQPYETVLNKGVQRIIVLIQISKLAQENFPDILSGDKIEKLVLDNLKKRYLPLISPKGKNCLQPEVIIYSQLGPLPDELLNKVFDKKTININFVIDLASESDEPVAVIQKKYFRAGLDTEQAWELHSQRSGVLVLPVDRPIKNFNGELNRFIAADMFFGLWASDE